MSQITHGLWAVLSNPVLYDLVQNAQGAKRYRRTIAREYVAAAPSHRLRVLDVGCGTAAILPYLSECSYVGIDMSAEYIEAAKRRYGHRAEFLCVRIGDASFGEWREHFDLALMLGLLHHLEDPEALALLRSVGPSLAPGGRVVAVEPTITEHTHPIGRFLVARDRGRNVRSPEAYQSLARQAFHQVHLVVRHDLLRVPYSHAVLNCSRPT
jgi:SAM-dependent methyltransferase